MSPTKGGRSESLRSTWMTNASECLEEDQELNQDALPMRAFLTQPLSDWVYWQRDAVALPDCWTRVFAVFCRNILWLYRYEDASAKNLLVCMHVRALARGTDRRHLEFRNEVTAASVQLYLPDAPALTRWHSHVSRAMTTLSQREQEEERSALQVRAVAPALKQQRFWNAVVLKIKGSSKGQSAGHEERKSLKQRWKGVTSGFKTTLKRDRQCSRRLLQGERNTVG